MASLQLLKPPSPSFPLSDFRGRLYTRRKIFGCVEASRLRFGTKKLRVFCAVEERDNNNQKNGEEPPESLFMKELKRRGMTPTSLIEDNKKSNSGIKLLEEDGGFSKGNAVSTQVDQSLSNQRERSMALNSEGLEGLVPRAKLLLSIGGTFFLGFGPLILITVAFFCALYLYFGSAFVHDASSRSISPPQYIDPYALLEDERISQIAPNLK